MIRHVGGRQAGESASLPFFSSRWLGRAGPRVPTSGYCAPAEGRDARPQASAGTTRPRLAFAWTREAARPDLVDLRGIRAIFPLAVLTALLLGAPQATPAPDPLPQFSIASRHHTVALSWDPQPSPTEVVTGTNWSAAGTLDGAVAAVDKDFCMVRDDGVVGEPVCFEIRQNAPVAFFVPRASATLEARGGVRLDGTFIQFQDWMKQLDAAAWQKELEAIQACGLHLILIQWVQYNGISFLPAGGAENDPTEIILAFADRAGWQVFVGLAMDDGWWNQSTDADYLNRTADAVGQVADEVWRRYGAHPSFAGWYLPQETWDGDYTDSQTTALRAFFRKLSDRCKRLSGDKPVAFSPFFSGQSTPAAMQAFYQKLLEGAGLDILMLQDGVGARGWDAEVAARVVPYFRAVGSACLKAGVAFWSDLESFRLASADPLQFAPAEIGRLCQQLVAEAPFVQHIVTFDFFHYLSPYRGAAQKQLHDDYVAKCVERRFLPTFGRSVEVDPQFGYYLNRSPASIASEIRANGYAIVRYILTADSAVRPELIAAFQREGLGVWHATFANGTYNTNDLPPGWTEWRMVTRRDLEGHPLEDGYTRLCLNNPAYRAWKKAQIGQMLQNHPFQGVDLMEPHWPEYPGPESPAYACFCPSCLLAFRQMFPEEEALPEIVDPLSPRSPALNPALWQKWLEFRRRRLTSFLDDLVNGDQGIRTTAPGRPVCVWTLALSRTNGLDQIREIHGEDPAEIAQVVRPDLLCLQTHWPDWTRAGLAPSYVLAYRPFVDTVRAAAPDLPIMIQADTGSQTQNRRSWTWIREFERVCSGMGVLNTTFYEYFIGAYMYTDAPKIVALRQAGDELELRFNKRLDPETASDTSRYQLSAGWVLSIRVDGNRVLLNTEGAEATLAPTLTVRGLKDAATLRLFQDHAAVTLSEQTVRLR